MKHQTRAKRMDAARLRLDIAISAAVSEFLSHGNTRTTRLAALERAALEARAVLDQLAMARADEC